MFEMYIVAAAIALIAAGAGIAILAIFAVQIYREDKAYSLSTTSPSRIAGGVRAIIRAYAHPWASNNAGHPRQDLALAGHARSARLSGRRR